MNTRNFSGFNAPNLETIASASGIFILAALLFAPLPAQAQYGTFNAPYTQTANLDNCASSSVSLNTMAVNQFYLYSASGVSVLYASGVNIPVTTVTKTINLQNAPPANATIVKAFLEVVEQGTTAVFFSGPVSFGGNSTAAGLQAGQGNMENKWTDPRYGADAMNGVDNFFGDVRYDVTSLVSPGTASYSTNAPGVMECLVVVYTIPSPSACGAVALGDGLFVWDGALNVLDWGVTPWTSTLDWSCQHNNSGANQFSRWGGTTVPDGIPNFSDEFFGTTTPDPAQPPDEADGAGTIFRDSSIINDTFLDTYNNVQLSSNSGKITWALGNPLSGGKAFYYVNLLAASCNSICDTPTPTSTPTSTNTGTSTFTPTVTATPTSSSTSTSSFTPTLSPTPTNSFTSTNTGTSTFTFTPTSTSTFSFTPTLSPTATPSPTPTNTNTSTLTPTATSTPTASPTFTLSFTPTDSPTATASATSTNTRTETFTSTITPTPTVTLTPTSSLTSTNSPTATLTPTRTATPTLTRTFTVTFTRTSTNTPAATFTFTPSLTATQTPWIQGQKSPTPRIGQNPGIIIYPNPAKGTDHVACWVSPGSEVVCKVFTTAFRKVNEINLGEIPAAQNLSLPLRDAWGTPLANGLYYLVVSSKTGKCVGKLIVQR